MWTPQPLCATPEWISITLCPSPSRSFGRTISCSNRSAAIRKDWFRFLFFCRLLRRPPAAARDLSRGHTISCSIPSNRASSKKSRTVIFKPAHILAIVPSVGLLLPVLMMLFNVDCVNPHSSASLLTVILFASHKSRIRCRTASLIFTDYNTFMISLVISLSIYSRTT